jgi:hypothetical protein
MKTTQVAHLRLLASSQAEAQEWVSAINSNVKALNNAHSAPDWTRTSSNTPLERAPQQPAPAPALTQHTQRNAHPLPPVAPAAPAASQPQQPQVLSLLALVVEKRKY